MTLLKNLLVLALMFAGSAQAQTSKIDEFSLEDLLNIQVTTATKKAVKLEETPGSITVITRQQILDTNARTLRDVLNVFVPGMDVVPTYFRYGDRVSEGVYSRGLLSDFSQQVLFLLNGMGKFNETTFSSAYPTIEFTLENVERVEISRSPIPLYGGSAITIINIITREQNIKDGVEFFGDFADNQDASFKSMPVTHRRYSANFGKPIDDYWHISGSVQTYSDYGQKHREKDADGGYTLDRATLRDGTKSAMNGSLILKSTDDKWFVQTNYKEINRDSFMSGAVPSESLGIFNYGGSNFLANIRYKPNSRFEVTLGGMRSVFENVVDFAGLPYGGEVKNHDIYAEMNYNWEFNGAGTHSWLNGVKVENEGQFDGTAYIWDDTANHFDTSRDETLLFAPNISRTVYAIYSEDTWKPTEAISVVAGARYDRYSGFGNDKFDIINPRLALSYVPNTSWVFKALYASASRPPSIYEKVGVNLTPLFGNSGNASGVGNLDDIKPESVQTAELSAMFKAGGFKAQVTPFYQIFQDKIEFAPAGIDLNGAKGTTDDLQSKNNGKANVSGADIDLWYYISKKSYFFVNGSFFSSKDDKTKEKTQFIPDVYVNGGVNFNAKKMTYNLTAFYRGKRELPAALVNSQKFDDPHMNANLSINYDWTSNFTVYGLVENVADSLNIVPLAFDGEGVPLRGRTYHLGLRWTM
jgi:outer membrane receptor for ferrienterochelin and colicins